ncbi:MAG: M4 family metallopeptidase [Acidimicrobiales bacterium]
MKKWAVALVVSALMAVAAPLTLAVPAAGQLPPPPPEVAGLAGKLQADGAGDARRVVHAATGKLRFVGATLDRPIRRKPGVVRADPPEKAARAFLADYGPLFGVANQGRDLALERATTDDRGHSSTRFQQTHQGVPVLGGELIVTLDEEKNVLSAGGEALPDLQVPVAPTIGAQAARTEALKLVAKERGVDVASLTTGEPKLWIYDPRLLGGPGIEVPILGWRVDVTAEEPQHIAELVLIDAERGGVALNFDQVAHAKVRHVCDRNNVREPLVTGRTPCAAPYVRNEGQPATGNADVDDAYDFAGHTYDFYANRFNRDSIDGAGMELFSTVRYCENSGSSCPFANAFWSPTVNQMFYGQGEADDDTVGHELTHGVTNTTSELFLWMQSGAISESLSDVFGELIDLTNGRGNDDPTVRWKLFEESPSGAKRDMKNPPAFGHPDRMRSSAYLSTINDNGGVHTNGGVNNKAAYLMTDGATFNGKTVTGIGIDKVAQIYYYVQTRLLTSGSDYEDLYNALRQACSNLIGSVGITAADCAEVTDAVDATEMNLQPITGADVAEDPICPAGQSPRFRFQDDMENAETSPTWDISRTVGTANWSVQEAYATSGRRHLYGRDATVASDFSVFRTADIVPEAGKTTYLRFRHAFDFEDNMDGGVVEYSTNGGTTWVDAGPLFTPEGTGYTFGNISDFAGTALAGRPAFTNTIGGYHFSRVDLSSLAGQNVRYRFRVATDSQVGRQGWFIDDVWVHTCENGTFVPAAPTVSAATAGSGSATVRWTAPPSNGGSPVTSYVVTPYAGNGATPGTPTTVSSGSAISATVGGLTNGTAYTFTVAAVNAVGRGAASSRSDAVTPIGPATTAGGSYRPLDPARIVDSRFAVGVPTAPIPAGGEISFAVTGVGGVPASGVSAVVLNVVATNTAALGYFTVYPTGRPRPLAANLNWAAGATVPNLVQMPVGTGGKVTVFNGSGGSTDIVVDVSGWVTDAAGATGPTGLYNPVVPTRLADTRAAPQRVGPNATIGPNGQINVTVAGPGQAPGNPVPATGVSAVVLNVTVTNPGAAGFLTAYPTGQSRPLAANLNWVTGQTAPNRVIAKVGTAGQVTLFNGSGATVDVVVDVGGWFTAATSPAGGARFSGLVPNRIADTRPPPTRVGPNPTVGPNGVIVVTVAGTPGVPAMGSATSPKAVVLNVAITNPGAAGYLTVYPSDAALPLAADQNWLAGHTRSNLVVVKVGPDGAIKLLNGSQANTDVVIDVVGWYS